jgi:uncharacterized protein (UPF0332 family)
LKAQNRQKLVGVLLEKARKSLDAATTLLGAGLAEAAISRAYYSSFYLAQAALATQDISRSKHSGVIAAFGEHLTKKALLPEDLHRILLELYEFRVTSDYSVEEVPSLEQAEKAINAAKRFSNEIEVYLRKWLSENPH